jgi:hypothetical protein
MVERKLNYHRWFVVVYDEKPMTLSESNSMNSCPNVNTRELEAGRAAGEWVGRGRFLDYFWGTDVSRYILDFGLPIPGWDRGQALDWKNKAINRKVLLGYLRLTPKVAKVFLGQEKTFSPQSTLPKQETLNLRKSDLPRSVLCLKLDMECGLAFQFGIAKALPRKFHELGQVAVRKTLLHPVLNSKRTEYRANQQEVLPSVGHLAEIGTEPYPACRYDARIAVSFKWLEIRITECPVDTEQVAETIAQDYRVGSHH